MIQPNDNEITQNLFNKYKSITSCFTFMISKKQKVQPRVVINITMGEDNEDVSLIELLTKSDHLIVLNLNDETR